MGNWLGKAELPAVLYWSMIAVGYFLMAAATARFTIWLGWYYDFDLKKGAPESLGCIWPLVLPFALIHATGLALWVVTRYGMEEG